MMLDTFRLAEAIRACDMGEVVKAMDEMTGVAHALFQTMEEFRRDVISILKNPPQEWTIAMEEKAPERTRCEACDGVAENLAEAVDDGWQKLHAVEGDAFGYLGLCPACHDDANERGEQGSARAPDAATQALHELLTCAELHQDDVEAQTRAVIARVHALLNAESEPITCCRCDATSPTLAAAVEQGWHDLGFDPYKKSRYSGFCADCHAKEIEREFEEAQQRKRGRQTENKTLFDC
jgi:hypothetical protein